MAKYSKIEVKDKDLLSSLQTVLKKLLSSDQIDALLVPWRLPMEQTIMPTLITDPESLDRADPLSPCFPMNAAKLASRLTKRPSGQTIGLVMRPCEIRAFVELIKLKQGELDHVVIISPDCLGAFSNTDFAAFSKDTEKDTTAIFYEHILSGNKTDVEGMDLAHACRVCEHPVSGLADIRIGLYGIDHHSQVVIEGATPKGEDLVKGLGLSGTTEPSGRRQALDKLVSERTACRDEMFNTVSDTLTSIEGLSGYLARCVNCYNCRVACPVCYCRECVFVTDVFDHDPYQYLQWATHKGKVKMPTDTVFFHLTRMAHIGLTCVGCGQCANACPNDIPLMALFRTIAHQAQEAFAYEAGRDVAEPIPLSVFEDKEYEDVTGISTGTG